MLRMSTYWRETITYLFYLINFKYSLPFFFGYPNTEPFNLNSCWYERDPWDAGSRRWGLFHIRKKIVVYSQHLCYFVRTKAAAAILFAQNIPHLAPWQCMGKRYCITQHILFSGFVNSTQTRFLKSQFLRFKPCNNVRAQRLWCQNKDCFKG